MGVELHTMTGAAGTIELGGRTLFLSQYSVGALGTIRAWLKERLPDPWEVAGEALKSLSGRGLAPQVLKDASELILRAAHDDAKSGAGGIDSSGALRLLQEGEGVALLIWLAARPNHPTLDYDTVRELVLAEPIASLKQKVDRIAQLLQDSMQVKGSDTNPTKPAASLVPETPPEMNIAMVRPASPIGPSSFLK